MQNSIVNQPIMIATNKAQSLRRAYAQRMADLREFVAKTRDELAAEYDVAKVRTHRHLTTMKYDLGKDLKRGFDFSAALFGLILVLPMMALIAIAIKKTSPGSVFFTQTRVGMNGKPFQLRKFRSMVVGADKLGPSVTTAGDARITKIGRILRRTKLDELPQLWNVLVGEMSLVGPRPDVPSMVETYSDEMRRILQVRPGITSLASLHLRCEEDILAEFEDPNAAYLSAVLPAKIELDMARVQQNSLFFDITVIWQTFWALTGGRLRPMAEPEIVTSLRTMATQSAQKAA